ncbi:REP-associated tyrosine transposase [Spirosoma aerophilum]
MSEKYKVRDQSKVYFVTFTVVQWVDVFTRRHYKDLILDSIRYCVAQKGLELYAYCLMTNHLHMIVGSNKDPIQYIMRDMKRHTSTQLFPMIENDSEESRRGWMCWIFKRAGLSNPANNVHQLWQQGFHPIELFTDSVLQQKLDYIHNNPVEAGFVDEPEDYLYSSARNYAGRKGLIDVILV